MNKQIYAFLALVAMTGFASASIDANLKYGQKGTEVSELQEFLIDKGMLQSSPTGFFGLLTLKAVKGYQASVGVPSTGYVGMMTREKMNDELNTLVDASDDAEKKELGAITEPEDRTKSNELARQVTDLNKQLEEQKRIQAETNSYIAQIARNTSPTTKTCQDGKTVAISDNCIKTCWDGEKILENLSCKDQPLSKKMEGQPLTAIMTFHPNMPNNRQIVFMNSFNQCSAETCPLYIKTKAIYGGDSWETYGQEIDRLEFNFQDTTEVLNESNYKQHGWKAGEKVMLKSLTANLGDISSDDFYDIKFMTNGQVIPMEKNYNMFSFKGNMEMNGIITVYAKIKPSASGKNIQVTFMNMELVGGTTGLPIALPFAMPQSGRNLSLIQ